MEEVLLWIFFPMIGMLMSYLVNRALKKYVFSSSDARKKILIMTPYYITFSIYMMCAFTLSKNYFYTKLNKNGEKLSTILYSVLMGIIPLITLPLSRYYLLRKARTFQNPMKLRKNQRMVKTEELASPDMTKGERQMRANLIGSRESTGEENMFKVKHKYCADFINALKIWDNQPIIEAYFSSSSKIYNDNELKDIKRLKNRRRMRR
jgi:phosphate/sulfate permease